MQNTVRQLRNLQAEGIDHEGMFSPVVRFIFIVILVAMVIDDDQ